MKLFIREYGVSPDRSVGRVSDFLKCDYGHVGGNKQTKKNHLQILLVRGSSAFEGRSFLAGLQNSLFGKIAAVSNSFRWVQYSPPCLFPTPK